MLGGEIILGIGIGMIVLAVGLFLIGTVYRKTAGKKIREELEREYGEG